MQSSRKESNFRLRQQSSRATKTNCEICQNKFQMLVNQQHQCKRCWRAICINCASSRIKVFQMDGTGVIHKICKICQKDEDMINALIQEYKLIFLMSSKLAEDWMKKINKERHNFQDIINEYEEMKFQSNSNTIKFKSQSKKLCEELFNTYHYSMRQFIGKMTQEIRNETIYQSASNVMLALFAYLKEMPYVPELIYFVVYLLCFCSEFQCYFIISRFIQKVYPQYLRLEHMKRDNLLSHQLKIILEMYKLLAKRIDKQQLTIMSSFLQNRFLSYVKSFTVNTTSISISFFIIDQMLKNSSYIHLYKGIAATIYNSREIIYEGRDSNTVDSYILSEISLQQIKNSFMVFEKSGVKFEMDHQFFDSAQHRKLHDKYIQLQSLYSKSDEKYKSLEIKYKSFAKQYEQIVAQLAESKEKTASLQQEIIKLADKILEIDQLEQYKQENQTLLKKNSYATETIKLLEQKLQEVTKQYSMEQYSRKMYIKLQQDYQDEIVDLKTKNEVYEIQKLANDINFSTSFIDEKFQEKNKQIMQLQRQNNCLKEELEFYKSQKTSQFLSKASFAYSNGRNQSLFHNHLSFIPTKGEQSKRGNSLNLQTFMNSSKQQKESLKKLFEANKQLIKKLKNELKNAETKNELIQKQVTRMKEIIQIQKNQIAVSSQINSLMKQIPEEINYTKNLSDFQKIIGREQNLHKKSQLELILSSFRKCLLEVRYRAIDSKIKQNKIRELSGLPIITSNNHSTNTFDNLFYEKGYDDGQDITSKLSWLCNQEQVSKVNRLIIKQETCDIM